MRLNGDQLSSGDDEGEEREQRKANSIGVGFPQPQKLVVVGYALTSKKKKSFLQPKLEGLARNKGILFMAIDLNRPLSDQGPFDVVLHKIMAFGLTLFSSFFLIILKDYRQKHPEVTVLDPPDAIQHVHNRQSMLQDVADLNLSNCYGKVGVPTQLVVAKDSSSIPDEVTKAGLKLPLVAKPLVVDGSAKSHELFLAYDQFSLAKLEPPLVLQEFINHASADDADLDPGIAGEGLRLFNIDIIRQHGTRDMFYVIDINYFPGNKCASGNERRLLEIIAGYGKMPEYEHIFTDFLLSLVQSKYKKRPTT
ncbi:hypothetical protein L1049_014613 [Liquidambar formosana]|uniref:Inositol-tetrakisphosphate 1-kinase n=1 Tax=Liquidambar formosana TaxID=63359 RepID=A0AAP0RWU2_LIQFO